METIKSERKSVGKIKSQSLDKQRNPVVCRETRRTKVFALGTFTEDGDDQQEPGSGGTGYSSHCPWRNNGKSVIVHGEIKKNKSMS